MPGNCWIGLIFLQEIPRPKQFRCAMSTASSSSSSNPPGPANSKVEQAFLLFQKSGEPSHLGEVFDATAGELMRVALHLSGESHDAEDLVQATFLAAIQRCKDYEPRGSGSVLAWLMGILTK